MAAPYKIYLLRHEKRVKDISFSASLNENGLSDADSHVKKKLLKLDITEIYCSPFLRTLQTVAPFARETGMKVNLEWSLVESFPAVDTRFPEFEDIINTDYVSFLPYDDKKATGSLANFLSLQQNTRAFVDSLKPKGNILFVTHLPVINAILSNRGIEYIEMFTNRHAGGILSFSTGDYV